VDTGSREENTSKQQDRTSVLIESEPKGLIQPQGCTIRLPAHAKGGFNPQTKTPPFAAGSSRGGESLTGSRVNS